jgi:hypothetical protein
LEKIPFAALKAYKYEFLYARRRAAEDYFMRALVALMLQIPQRHAHIPNQ